MLVTGDEIRLKRMRASKVSLRFSSEVSRSTATSLAIRSNSLIGVSFLIAARVFRVSSARFSLPSIERSSN